MPKFKTGDVVEFTEDYMEYWDSRYARTGDRAIVLRSKFGHEGTLVNVKLAKNGVATTVYESRIRHRTDGHLFDIGDRITGEARFPFASETTLTGTVNGYPVGALSVNTDDGQRSRHILTSTAVLVQPKKEEEKIVTEQKRALVGPKPEPVPVVHPYVQTPLDTRDGDEDVFDASGKLLLRVNADPFDSWNDRLAFAQFVAEAVNEKVARDLERPLYVLNSSNKDTEPPAHVQKLKGRGNWTLVRFGTGWWFKDETDNLPGGRDNGWRWSAAMISNYDLPMTEVRS